MQKIREACFCDCHGTKKLNLKKLDSSLDCEDGDKFKGSKERKKIQIEVEETDTSVTTTAITQTSCTTTSIYFSNGDNTDVEMTTIDSDGSMNEPEKSKAECPCVIFSP